MDKSDLIRLQHMLDASREVQSFAQGRKREDLEEDRMLVLALLKGIEILGEAASKVGDLTKEKFPNIPWRQIIDGLAKSPSSSSRRSGGSWGGGHADGVGRIHSAWLRESRQRRDPPPRKMARRDFLRGY